MQKIAIKEIVSRTGKKGLKNDNGFPTKYNGLYEGLEQWKVLN